MCGIAGYVDPAGALDGQRVLTSLAAALAHRGPDGEGFFSSGPFGLAHRRLAIIDLSEGGAQPMQVGPISVVFNGEIYNYLELRQELSQQGQVFSGASDTEVLARAYLQWGEAFTERLRGMWAFAIVDSRSGSLLCARDPFGIKPLYYTRRLGAFVFASEPQALLRAGVPARANLRIASQYLALGVSDHAPESFFADVTPLEAGAMISVSSELTIRAAGHMRVNGVSSAAAASTEEFAANLRDSVRLHLRSDVPVGTCLSGGLDSSTLAALASSAARQAGAARFAAVTALSTDPASDERGYAAEVVRHCRLDWHTVTPIASEFVAEVDLSVRAQGEPALSPSTYFQYCVMRAAREAGLKVMLDGQGADELLCGYERYVPVWALDTARQAGVFAAVRGFVSLARGSRPGLSGMTALAAYVLQPRLRRRVISSRAWFLHRQYADCVLELLADFANASRDLRQARLADIARFSLPALLRFEDRNSMAHSIEARVPYVDRGVVSCALRLPGGELLRDGFTKYPLRVLAASVAPADIAWRRSKVGFEPPTRAWLAALGHRMEVEVEQSSLIRRLCRAVPRVADQPLAIQWRLYNLARWQHLYAVAVD